MLPPTASLAPTLPGPATAFDPATAPLAAPQGSGAQPILPAPTPIPQTAATPLQSTLGANTVTGGTQGANAGAPATDMRPLDRAATAPTIEMLPFQEAHWQGLELITLTPGLARFLKIPTTTKGVAVDEVTMPADTQGFFAGDIVLAVGGHPTPTLDTFVAAAGRARDQREVQIDLLRKSETKRLLLAALGPRLGDANGETAPTIPSAAPMPHAYQGPCTQCHRIGNGANLVADLGDPLTKKAPQISAAQRSPHQNRGTCSACHTIR